MPKSKPARFTPPSLDEAGAVTGGDEDVVLAGAVEVVDFEVGAFVVVEAWADEPDTARHWL